MESKPRSDAGTLLASLRCDNLPTYEICQECCDTRSGPSARRRRWLSFFDPMGDTDILWRMTREGKRSPLQRSSLPQAGESLGDAALDLFLNGFLIYFSMGLTLVVVAVIEWWYWWLRKPLSPWFWTAFAVMLCAIAAWRYARIKPQLQRLRQGRRGEREVGRMLEELRALGYTVFHDLPDDGVGGGRFNVDHALIGPGGVFAIETKTWSKPAEGRAEVDYDGQRVLVAGMTPERDPVVQAQASADHVAEILKRMTARDVFVRPVVLFPGWWVNPQPRGCRTWVLNPKSLRAFLANEPNRLTREDVALFNERLTLHLSAGEP